MLNGKHKKANKMKITDFLNEIIFSSRKEAQDFIAMKKKKSNNIYLIRFDSICTSNNPLKTEKVYVLEIKKFIHSRQ